MPKPLSNQLEELENQINYFLSTKRIDDDNYCKAIRGRSVKRHHDGNVDQIEFEGTTCSPTTCKSQGRPLSSPESTTSKGGICKLDCQGDPKRPKRPSSSPKKISYCFDVSQKLCSCAFNSSPCMSDKPKVSVPKKCSCKLKGAKDGKGAKEEEVPAKRKTFENEDKAKENDGARKKSKGGRKSVDERRKSADGKKNIDNRKGADEGKKTKEKKTEEKLDVKGGGENEAAKKVNFVFL